MTKFQSGPTTAGFSPLVTSLHNDGSRGWEIHDLAEKAVGNGEDVVIFSIGDPDFSTPKPIVDSAVNALRAGDTHYTPMSGRYELRSAVSEHTSTRTGLMVKPENVVITAGTQNALFGASLCLLGRGDEVIALEPMYLTYASTLTVGGATLRLVGQKPPEFRPDIDAIANAINEHTKALVITNPNNPTGVVLSGSELEAIAELATAHDLWVISDEVYCEVVFDGDFTSIASLPGMAERTVICGSLSKSHAMTGWRVGWAVGPRQLIEHIEALQVIVNYGVPGFVQQAAVAALEEFGHAATEMREIYERRRNLAAKILSEVDGLEVLVPPAGMYLMLNVDSLAESSSQFCRELFAAERVALLDAAAFGSSADGWVRLSFTVDDERVVEGCQRIASFIGRQRGGFALK